MISKIIIGCSAVFNGFMIDALVVVLAGAIVDMSVTVEAVPIEVRTNVAIASLIDIVTDK